MNDKNGNYRITVNTAMAMQLKMEHGANSSNNTQASNSQPAAWSSQQQARNQAAQNTPTSEDQALTMLGGANGDLQATRTSNGWTFSGDGYTATVGDDGSISHN